MDKSYPPKTPMVVRSLDNNKDQFRQKDEDEELSGPEIPYLSAIGALMYVTNCTRPDIVFAVNLLVRHSAALTKRHWIGVKNIFRYLQGTTDLGLFYQFNQDKIMIGYTDAGYYLISIMPNLRHVLYFYIVERLYHENYPNKL